MKATANHNMRKFPPKVLTRACMLGSFSIALIATTTTIADNEPKQVLSASRLTNTAEVRKRLGLTPEYARVFGVQEIKIAVLDYGFDGVNSERAYLPESAVLVEHYDPEFVRRHNLGDPEFRKEFAPQNRHGRTLAQIVWAVTGAYPQGPQFYLLNANGPTMLRRAVRYAIEQKVDIILFSGSFEGGGNGDGRGAINRVVSEALSAGIIWVNAAGNYGRRVFNAPVRIGHDGYLRFRDGPDGSVLRFKNHVDENSVTVTLTWNDYREQEDAGTTKDLDLYVEDWVGKRLGASEKKQVAGQAVAGPEESRNPRERLVLGDLAAHANFNYRIRVRKKGGIFTPDDRVRVLISATRETYVTPTSDKPIEAVKFVDATGGGELYPPADHPLVITVGDSSPDSSLGPTADNRLKPDVILEDSRAFFSDGEVTAGSSNAAAYFAGVVAVLKATEPKLNAQHLFRLARQNTPNSVVKHTAYAAPYTQTMPAPIASFQITGPRGNTVGLQFGPSAPYPFPNPTTQPRPTASNFPLAALRASRPETPATLENRLWRTPTRSQLKSVIRENGQR